MMRARVAAQGATIAALLVGRFSLHQLLIKGLTIGALPDTSTLALPDTCRDRRACVSVCLISGSIMGLKRQQLTDEE
jgi:hypothetical protein